MNRTYAYNSIIFGVLLGILAEVKTDSIALGVVVFLAVSVVGFIIIRMFEKAVDKGVDKAADKLTELHNRRKVSKMTGSESDPKRETTRMPERW